MKAFIPATVAACLATACASEPRIDDGVPGDREVGFSCSNGPDLSVRFFPAKGVAILLRNGETVELQQQPSGSGFTYSNGRTSIRGKGDDLTVEIGRMAPLQCKAK